MSIIPDYANQASELRRQIEAQAEVTAQYWSDRKRWEYYDQYVGKYIDWLDKYVYGGSGIRGMGLNELLQFVAKKIDKFESVAESSITGNIIATPTSTGNYPGQIYAPLDCPHSELLSIGEDIPQEQAPANITENRNNWTVDYKLNSPGSFSAENLRNILKRRRNG